MTITVIFTATVMITTMAIHLPSSEGSKISTQRVNGSFDTINGSFDTFKSSGVKGIECLLLQLAVAEMSDTRMEPLSRLLGCACSGSAMALLAQLHPLLPQRPGNSCSHIRRLWPFLRHNLAFFQHAEGPRKMLVSVQGVPWSS